MLKNQQLFAVMRDERFQQLLGADRYLDELEAEKHNRSDEYFALLAVLGGGFRIGTVAVRPLTAAVWSILWVTDNAYTKPGAEPSTADTDLFFHLLREGVQSGFADLDTLLERSAGSVAAAGLDYAEARLALSQSVAVAFRPLEMLPGVSGDVECVYDADWLTRLVARVCKVTNLTPDRVMFELPLVSCCYYFIQAAREYDVKGLIRRRSNEEICEEIYRYTMELAERFYEENLK